MQTNFPLLIMAILSPNKSASSMKCVDIMIVRFSLCLIIIFIQLIPCAWTPAQCDNENDANASDECSIFAGCAHTEVSPEFVEIRKPGHNYLLLHCDLYEKI